jgi:hypothetical protein
LGLTPKLEMDVAFFLIIPLKVLHDSDRHDYPPMNERTLLFLNHKLGQAYKSTKHMMLYWMVFLVQDHMISNTFGMIVLVFHPLWHRIVLRYGMEEEPFLVAPKDSKMSLRFFCFLDYSWFTLLHLLINQLLHRYSSYAYFHK